MRTSLPGALLLAFHLSLAGSLDAQIACGDCDCNGSVTILDALLTSQMAAGIVSPAPVQQVKCDTNASTSINVIDALIIAQVAAGLSVTPACPGTGNAPPTASNCTNLDTMGDIPIDYLLSDPESDTCDVLVEYSTNGGATYVGPCTEQPMGSSGTTGLVTTGPGVTYTFVWDTIADLGMVNVPATVVRITPMDMQAGFRCATLPFTVGNQPGAVPPQATGCVVAAPPCGGPVTIDFDLIDPDSPTVDITVEYSTNGGTTFTGPPTEGAGSSGTMSLAASAMGTTHTFVWDVTTDLPPGSYPNAAVRITPDDGTTVGSLCQTMVFPIDLSSPGARPGPSGTHGAITTGVVDVWVVDDTGMPISGASVLVGSAPGVPFAGNFGTTDPSGQIRFCDPALAAGMNTVTAGATGRQYLTFYETSASEVVFELKQIDQYPPTTEVFGDVTGLNVPGCSLFSPQVGAAIALPVVQANDLLTGLPRFVIGPNTCWQGGSLTGDLELPGNAYIPQQQPICAGPTVNEHELLFLFPQGVQQQMVAIYGTIPAAALTGGASIPALIGGFNYEEFGITNTFTPTGASQRRDIPSPGALNQNVTITVDNVPAGMDAFGIVGADLSASNGDGPLAAMGLGLADAMALAGGAPVAVNATTTPASSFSGPVTYLSLAAALFVTGTAPPGQEDALVGVVKRDGGITAGGGSVTFNTFFSAPTQTPPPAIPGTFTVNDPSSAAPNVVDVIVHRFERRIEDASTALPPCMGAIRENIRSSIYWEVYTRGGLTSFTLPTLPGSFPRASTTNGLFTPAATPEMDTIEWNPAFIGFGGTGLPTAPAFDFDQFVVEDFPLWLTHLAANFRTIQGP